MVPEWSGRRVTEARAWMRDRIERADAAGTPLACGECGEAVRTGQRFAVGHIKPRWQHPELTWEPSNWRAEHKRCSDSTGQQHVIAKARASVFSGEGGARETPPLPISPLEGSTTPIEARDGLTWPEFVKAAPKWLKPHLKHPADASPPLYVTPLPKGPKGARGSYALDKCSCHDLTGIEWVEQVEGKTLRWWQRLALILQLAYDKTGALVFREVVESCPRRAGKSVRMRGTALWRSEHGQALFGEQQLTMHTGSDIAICREVQRGCWRWADEQGWTVTKANGKEALETTSGDRWLVRSQDGVYGYDVTLGIVDEAWKVKPDTVSEGLEPATLERKSPQLHLTSTAHRRATSLMRSRISSALTTDSPGVLLMLWGAPADADPSDPAVWRAASPHWSDDRRRLIESKYAKALAGETDVEADDLDPMEGFKAQYLNVWRLRTPSKVERGEAVLSPEVWQAVGGATAPHRTPDAVAVEGWFAEGVAVACAWRTEVGPVVSVATYPDLSSAAAAVRATGYRGREAIGKSLADDPAAKVLRRRKPMQQRTISAADDLTRLVAEGLRHDDSEALTTQALALRTVPGPDGAVLASKERADAVKAAVWAAQALSKSAGAPRILMASA